MNKNILITGCSTGFGFNSAKYFAKKGHNVFATMRDVDGKNAIAASQLRDFATSTNTKITVSEIEVTSDKSVNSAVAEMPTIDVLINNAGYGAGGTAVEAFSSEEVMYQLDVNIGGTFRVAKAVLPGMRKNGSGLIINLSSIAGRGAFPGFGIYHASKWGVEGLSECMRYELAPLGIDVVIVEPGPFATEFFNNVAPAEDAELAAAYAHVAEFSKGFGEDVMSMFADDNAPTDPSLVVEMFDKLINTKDGQRPLRNIVGLDFGFQAINDAVEPVRKELLEGMGLSDWDGPKG